MIIITMTHTVHANQTSLEKMIQRVELTDDALDKTHLLRFQMNESLLEWNKMDLAQMEKNQR